MNIVAATFFGGPNREEFVAAGELADGHIMAIGNATGPDFPTTPTPTIVGQGQPSTTAPNPTGFWVIYSAGLKNIQKVSKFDWNVASISAGIVAHDRQSVILTGHTLDGFQSVASTADFHQVNADMGQASSDGYVMRLDPATGKPHWVWTLQRAGKGAERLWQDRSGAVYFDINGLHRISSDGKTITRQNERTGKWLAVDPVDGGAFYGGDRNTHTGREPWRQPYLYKFRQTGERQWKIWEFDPRQMGADHLRLVSDSSVRDVSFLPDGNLAVAGWSDGANSVFWRQAADWKRNAPQGGFLIPWYPSGATSLGHISVINPKSLETVLHLWWVAVFPSTSKKANRITSARVNHVVALRDGSLAFLGAAGLGLIQTPNAFWKPIGDNYHYSGETLGVWDKNFQKLIFSSYLPGLKNARVFATSKGLVCVSSSTGKDEKTPATESPAQNSLQPFGGATDGHILYLELPETASPRR